MPVTLAGSCIPSLTFRPTAIHFGRIDFAEPAFRFLEIAYGGKLDDPEIEVSIVAVKGSEENDVSSFFKLTHERESTRKFETTILYHGGLKGRSFLGELLIKSKDPEHRETKLSFTGFNKGPTP